LLDLDTTPCSQVKGECSSFHPKVGPPPPPLLTVWPHVIEHSCHKRIKLWEFWVLLMEFADGM
jgi:hypothetical protein